VYVAREARERERERERGYSSGGEAAARERRRVPCACVFAHTDGDRAEFASARVNQDIPRDLTAASAGNTLSVVGRGGEGRGGGSSSSPLPSAALACCRSSRRKIASTRNSCAYHAHARDVYTEEPWLLFRAG